MTDEQKAAYINGLAACLIGKLLGMQAENMKWLHLGSDVVYVEADFEKAVNESGVHHNAVLTLFSEGGSGGMGL